MSEGALGDTLEDGPTTNPNQDSCIHAWLDIRGLVERAGKGKIVRLPISGLDRQAVIDNAAILEPIIAFYGSISELDILGLDIVHYELPFPASSNKEQDPASTTWRTWPIVLSRCANRGDISSPRVPHLHLIWSCVAQH